MLVKRIFNLLYFLVVLCYIFIGDESMKNRKNIIIIILIILVVILDVLTFYLLSLYPNLNKENNELKTKISSQESKIKNSTPITEEKAMEIMENYRINTILDNNHQYKFTEIRIENIDCEYKYFINENQYLIDLQRPSQYRTLYNEKKNVIQAYAVYYKSDDGLDKMTGYIDLYTGEVLGVYQEGI